MFKKKIKITVLVFFGFCWGFKILSCFVSFSSEMSSLQCDLVSRGPALLSVLQMFGGRKTSHPELHVSTLIFTLLFVCLFVCFVRQQAPSSGSFVASPFADCKRLEVVQFSRTAPAYTFGPFDAKKPPKNKNPDTRCCRSVSGRASLPAYSWERGEPF